MCQLYVGADPSLYRSRARSVRLHGMVTSVRLENQFWAILERMAAQESTTSSRLISTLHDELLAHRGEVENFASFLRVCCIRFEEHRLTVLGADTAPGAYAEHPVLSVTAGR
jgi:predicted DNA-binding ribbon-helix-helix protein